MAYGFLAENLNGQTVINDSQPLYVEKRSGTMTGSNSGNYFGYYTISQTGNAVTTANEILLCSCAVGSWIAFGYTNLTGNTASFRSDQSSISFKVFGPRTDLAAPSGFGMAVFNSSGGCVWDAASTVTRITDAGRLASATITGSFPLTTTFQSATLTGSNAVFASGGPLILNSPRPANNETFVVQMAARRTGTATWVLEQKKTDRFGWIGIVGDILFASDYSYILGTN